VPHLFVRISHSRTGRMQRMQHSRPQGMSPMPENLMDPTDFVVSWTRQILSYGKSDSLLCVGLTPCYARATPEDVKRIVDEATYRKYLYFLRRKLLIGYNATFCAMDQCWEPIFPGQLRRGDELPGYYLQCNRCSCYTCLYCSCQIPSLELSKESPHRCRPCIEAQEDRAKQNEPSTWNWIGSFFYNDEQVQPGSSLTTEPSSEPRGFSNRIWFALHTKKCPNCASYLENEDGCSHVICDWCDLYFCFRCGGRVISGCTIPRRPAIHLQDVLDSSVALPEAPPPKNFTICKCTRY